MEELLTAPEKRPRKVTLLDEDIVIQAGGKLWDPIHNRLAPIQIVIPKGTVQATVGNLLYKQLLVDLTLSVTDPNALKARLKNDEAVKEVRALLDEVLAGMGTPMRVLDRHEALIRKYYTTSTDYWENAGHPFGTGLPDREKKALIAFVATL
jgi:hypothetical protein